MNATVEDLRPTIVPRSDQINAEQLLGGPMTITVTDVRIGNDEQPVIINYQGDSGRPYKPSKTQRKVLIFAWGENGRDWIGRSMTIFCDPKIKFGGEEVGGIRISHLSHIDRDINMSLTATKGKKAPHTIKRLAVAAPAPAPRTAARPPRSAQQTQLIADLERVARDQGFEAFKSKWGALSKEDRTAIGLGERDRIGAIGQDSDAAALAKTTPATATAGADPDDEFPDIPY